MSAGLVSAAFATDLDPAARFLLVALAYRADEAGQCEPTIAQLGEDTGYTRSTLFRSLRALEDAGHIGREVQPGKGTVYAVHPARSAMTGGAAR